MKSVKKVGADVGNDALKLYLNEKNYEGKDKLEVMNVVAPGYNRRIMGMEKGHLSNLLDVSIEIDGKNIGRYFVGGLAFKDNRGDLIEKTKRDIKATSMDTIILLVTGVAYAMYDPNNPKKVENIALGTLLPTEEYWDDKADLLKKFIENFGKSYKVKFHSPAFNGADITINFIDSEVQPESAAGHLTAIYDNDGQLRDGMQNIENEVHLGIFIGSITTEVSVYEHGEFNPKGFFGIELGTSDPLDKIIDDLGIEMTRHQIDYFIRNNKKLIVNIDGETKDITEKLKESKDQRFGFFVKQLVNRINQQLDKQGIKTSLINRVNLGGGGAITTFDNFVKEFNVGNITLVPDARFANALGALLSIVQKQDEQEVAAEEVLG